MSLMPRVGLEPTHLSAGDFESPASTNFATWAGVEAGYYTDFFSAVKRYGKLFYKILKFLIKKPPNTRRR